MYYQIESRSNDLSTTYIGGLTPLPHIHPHLELIYLLEGGSVSTVDNREFLFEKGDIFLSFPHQIHYYHDRMKPDGIMFIFSPDLFKELKELFYNKVPESPIIKSSQLNFDVKGRMKKILKKNTSSEPFDKIAARGYLLAFLGEILPLMNFSPVHSDQDSIKKLLTYCSENYTEPLTLDSVSAELHLNKYYISHIFKERMELGFTDFLNGLRTEHACTLLKKGVSITDVAFSSGFTSIRTFNRVFSQIMGMSPRDYIKAKE